MICNKCEVEKKEDRFEFRKDRGCFRKICKDCRNNKAKDEYPKIAAILSERRKEIREKNTEFLNKKARERYWKNRNELLEKARARINYKAHNKESIKKWRLKNKDKCAAQQSVSRALKSGRLFKAERCQMCSSQEKLNAHHHDYSKPIDVIWLCIPCHKKVHSKHFNTEE